MLPTANGCKGPAAFLHLCVYPTDATDEPWEFFSARGALCAPQGSKTVRCGYDTPRIPGKDTGSITHSAIICSYLKLMGCRGYLRDSGSTHTYTHTERRTGDFRGLRVCWALKKTQHKPGGGGRVRKRKRGEKQRILYVSLVIPAFFYGRIFFLLSERNKESP